MELTEMLCYLCCKEVPDQHNLCPHEGPLLHDSFPISPDFPSTLHSPSLKEVVLETWTLLSWTLYNT